MNHVREFHPISDEKHRHVVTHKVKVTLKKGMVKAVKYHPLDIRRSM
jgi:hypothetical protein